MGDLIVGLMYLGQLHRSQLVNFTNWYKTIIIQMSNSVFSSSSILYPKIGFYTIKIQLVLWGKIGLGPSGDQP
jgi:hypothetical protein